MAEGKPVVYLLRGDDEMAVKEFLDKLYRMLGDATIADMNFTRLDGRGLDMNELRTASGAMPFLAERRVVVLSNPPSAPAEKDRFCAFFDRLPDSTALVLLLHDHPRRNDWESYPEQHWLVQWARQAGDRALLRDLALPDPHKMAGWILKKAEEEQGEFTAQAAAALAERIGNDTRTATLEVQKLLSYVNYSRPVTREDIEQVSTRLDDPDIFALVEALGEKDGKKALNELHTLLEEEDWMGVFPMIVRQFRLLLLTREMMDAGGGPDRVAQELRSKYFNVAPFLAARLYRQAGRFSIRTLEEIYRQLLQVEETLKSTPVEPSVALDTFVVELVS